MPIIAVSTLALNGDQDKAFNVGFTNYQIRPFSIEKFLTVVNGYVE